MEKSKSENALGRTSKLAEKWAPLVPDQQIKVPLTETLTVESDCNKFTSSGYAIVKIEKTGTNMP
ncbi:Hypothetical predicted protein [Prunus dulcis]|uniref:Uncharacterized protein n=1 Tax=Prunus dulcis TaxID=3755 RepID=A0A5E4FLC5_PRUDU|nr:Hypothetical predicted protein [Prunus dulcis]